MASRNQKTNRALKAMRKSFDKMQEAWWQLDDMENYDLTPAQARMYKCLAADLRNFLEDDVEPVVV